MIRLDFELTPFVGRERERAQLEEAVRARRLVTIVGPGGTGKTRMAVEVANALAGSFPGGVRFVDLAVVEDPDAVIEEVVPPEAAAGGPALVVVDNCEHVLASAAGAISRLLEASPAVSVLATSREPLGIAGEAVAPLEPLPVPPRDADLDTTVSSEAVRMFVDRARLTNPHFQVSASNVADVRDLCREIDGLPLAIELVAPYMRALAPADIVRRIRERGVHGVPQRRDAAAERHATLISTIEWSYRLLSDEERRCLAALSVFTGRFTLDGAQELAAAAGVDRDRAVDVIVSLVDKSLVRVQHAPDATWYGLLEMVRSFAWSTISEDEGEIVLEREGELWRVGRGSETFMLRDAKGLRYIRALLDRPGEEISAATLASPHGEVVSAPLDAIDPEAKAAYRRRLEDLEEEIETAETLHDEARAARALSEREAILAELGRSLGMGGRVRKQGAESERARMSVTKAIRGAIEKIGDHDPQLASYLSSSIRTGTFCVYTPR